MVQSKREREEEGAAQESKKERKKEKGLQIDKQEHHKNILLILQHVGDSIERSQMEGKVC